MKKTHLTTANVLILRMIKGASLATQKMVELPYFKKDENIWFHVYPGKLHSEEAFVDRIWNALKIMWN